METIARHFYGFWQKGRKMKCVVQLPDCIACGRDSRVDACMDARFINTCADTPSGPRQSRTLKTHSFCWQIITITVPEPEIAKAKGIHYSLQPAAANLQLVVKSKISE